MSEALVEAIRRKPHRGSLKVDLKGPNEVSDSEDEQDEEGGRGYARWGTVGQLQMQFELLPKALAEERPVGKGRDEPNQFPALEEPEREKFSLNPFTTLATLVGEMKGGYKPPAGVNPNTTRIIDMCKGTCMGSGAGPCWLLGPQTPWCDVAEQGQEGRPRR